jgi:hypothetical protein
LTITGVSGFSEREEVLLGSFGLVPEELAVRISSETSGVEAERGGSFQGD